MNESARSGLLLRSGLVGLLLVLLPVAAHGAERTARPIHEGNDTRPCVTSLEFDLVRLDAPQLRVQRVWDTPGTVVRNSGVASDDGIVHAPRRHREVRVYPICPRPADGVTGGEATVEFDRSKRRTPMVAGWYDEWTDWAR